MIADQEARRQPGEAARCQVLDDFARPRPAIDIVAQEDYRGLTDRRRVVEMPLNAAFDGLETVHPAVHVADRINPFTIR